MNPKKSDNMPAPQKSMLSKLAKTNFALKRIRLPINWKQPGSQYPNAFKINELRVAPNPPMTLFKEATLNKYHVESARTVGKDFEGFIEGVCGALCDGIDKWMKMATVAGVIITGPVGILRPGCVIGPPLTPLILASAPKNTKQELKYSKAIAQAFGTLWQPWHMGLTGVLAYPAFAAFPGPVGPPISNVPIPLIAFASAGEAGLSPQSLKGMMISNLGDPGALHAPELFDAISTAFHTIFQVFKATTMFQKVLGTGPVPSFAPPVAPVGPVISGTVIPTPGVIV
jgi:hypothetical protein